MSVKMVDLVSSSFPAIDEKWNLWKLYFSQIFIFKIIFTWNNKNRIPRHN